MEERVVATTPDEVEAEVIASRLRAEGIPARVRYESRLGHPRSIHAAGLGFGAGSFRVMVRDADAARAGHLIGSADDDAPARAGPPLALRVIAAILLIGFLASALGGVALLRP